MGFIDKTKKEIEKKGKKQIKKVIWSIVLKILPYLLVFMLLLGLIGIWDAVCEEIKSMYSQVTTYTTNLIKSITDDYWMDLSQKVKFEGEEERTLIDQYMYRLENLGISLKDLNLLGEANYDDPNLLSDPINKAKVQKYLKSFVVSELITTQIHRRNGNGLTKVDSGSPLVNAILGDDADLQITADKVDGGIYLYRTKDATNSSEVNNQPTNNKPNNVPQTNKPTVDFTGKNINTSKYGLNSEEVTLQMDNITHEYKIAWISDLHMMQPNEPNINNEWYTNHSTTFTQRNNSFNNSYNILPKIVECLNGNDFDAIVFGGDIMDNYSEANFNYLKEQINKITNKNIMFLVADHDYLTEMTTNTGVNKEASSLGVSGDIKQITIGKDGDAISLVGQNYSNEKISDSAVNNISNQLNKASNSLFFTHVPVESKTQASQMQTWSRNVHNNQVYYWSKQATSSGYNDVPSNYLNTLYDSKSLKGVFAGHVHASGDFELNTGIKQHIFNASYNNNIGVITIRPSGKVEGVEETKPEQNTSEIDEIDNYYRMEYTELEKFKEMIEDFNNDDDPNISKMEKCFSIDEDDNLLIAQINGYTKVEKTDGEVTSTKNSYTATIKKIDYKQKVAEFGLPYEFLIDLCMVTQNPEYVFHVAQMALDTRIDILLINNETTQITERERKKTKHHDDGTTSTYTLTTIKTEKSTNPVLELKYANSWSKYQKVIWTNKVDESTKVTSTETSTTTKTKITNTYSSIEGSVIRKSDNFLGLLRNSTGRYISGTTPSFKVEGSKFDRYGKNVEYKLPNLSTYEAPLNNLISGEEAFYELLRKNERTEPLVELIQYYLTFPEQEYYELDESEIKEILGGFNDASLSTKYDKVTDDELEILYKICEAEAGGSKSEEEIGHVASVILNRVKCSSWGNTIKDVVFQKNQFAPITDGHYDKAVPSDKTKRAVDYVLANGDTTGGAVYFRTEKSAISAGMPTSSSDKHPSYIYLFTDPNTHVFLTNQKALDELQASKTPELDGSSQNLVEAAEKVHRYVRDNKYTYAQKGVTVPNYKTRTIDCSSYVTWVLLEAGYRSSRFYEGMYQWTSVTFRTNSEGWQVIKNISDAKAGDILCYNGHVEIYAGETNSAGTRAIVYNCGGNSSIKAIETSVSGHSTSQLLKILRVPI